MSSSSDKGFKVSKAGTGKKKKSGGGTGGKNNNDSRRRSSSVGGGSVVVVRQADMDAASERLEEVSTELLSALEDAGLPPSR